MRRRLLAWGVTLCMALRLAAGLGAVSLDMGGLLAPPAPPAAGVVLRPDDTATVARGQAVYVQHCAVCHGANLEGQPNWQQRKADGRLPAPPHDASGHTWHHSDEQLFELTKLGPARLAGGGYQSDMPGYEGILGDSDIAAVLSYIVSTWPAEIRQRRAPPRGTGG